MSRHPFSRSMHWLPACLATLLALAATAVAAQDATSSATATITTITTPRGGWRASPSTERDFVQEVHYPASNVNTEGLSGSAQIAGRIARDLQAQPKPGRQPARLIVDGVALPLDVKPDGSFARPWSFGAGAHGVTVRPAGTNGAADKRVQFIEANAGRAAPRLRVVLSWDTDQTDLGQRVVPNGGALDVDVTTGFGPEIVASRAPLPGIYHVYVNYYGSGERADVITVAQVALITNEGRPDEKQEVFRVPLRKPGELTLVRSFVMP